MVFSDEMEDLLGCFQEIFDNNNIQETAFGGHMGGKNVFPCYYVIDRDNGERPTIVIESFHSDNIKDVISKAKSQIENRLRRNLEIVYGSVTTQVLDIGYESISVIFIKYK